MALRQQIKPNRMELLKLRKRLKIARRGHKLLKDKQDKLIQELIVLLKEEHKLRQETPVQRKEYEDNLTPSSQL